MTVIWALLNRTCDDLRLLSVSITMARFNDHIIMSSSLYRHSLTIDMASFS